MFILPRGRNPLRTDDDEPSTQWRAHEAGMSQRKAQHCGFTYPRGNRPSGTDQTSTQWRTLEAGTRAPTDSSPAVSSDGERLNLLLFSRLPRLDRLHFTTNSLRWAQTLRHGLTLLTLALRVAGARGGQFRLGGSHRSLFVAPTGRQAGTQVLGASGGRFRLGDSATCPASAATSTGCGSTLLLGLRGRR